MAIGLNASNNQDYKMKKKLKISTLIFGIVVAIIAISNSNSYADTFETIEPAELKTLDTEMLEGLEVLEKLLDKKYTDIHQDRSLKIYNYKSQLVYETNDKNDDHLKNLLRRSDLVLHTDTSSYYLLGD